MSTKTKPLQARLIAKIEPVVILLLLNCIQQEEKNGGRWNVNNPNYAEAFGIFRCLILQKYCFDGSSTSPSVKMNASFWMYELQTKAEEEAESMGIEEAIEFYERKCS